MEKLNNKLLAVLDKLRYTRELKQKANKEFYCTFNAYLNASAQLLCLKKICKKVRSKEYRLME